MITKESINFIDVLFDDTYDYPEARESWEEIREYIKKEKTITENEIKDCRK